MAYTYFAYGSNLDATHFVAWCAEHQYAGVSLAEGSPAELDDWELQLSVPSRYWGGAVGTIVPRVGSMVHGAIFSLSDDAAGAIRHKEGVTTGLYRELELEVRTAGTPGGTFHLRTAHAFVAQAGREVPVGSMAPSPRWLDTVRAGGTAHGLPRRWVDGLGKAV